MIIFEREKAELAGIGFHIAEDSTCKDLRYLSVTRVVHDFISQGIFLTQSSLRRDNFCVVLSISVRVPDFVERLLESESNTDNIFTEAMQFEVTKDGFDERGWGRAQNFPIDRHAEFETALHKRILPWLDAQSDPQTLLSVLKSQLEGCVVPLRRKIPFRWKVFNYLVKDSRSNVEQAIPASRPINNKLIADILYHLGEREKAVYYMKRWVELHASRPLWAIEYVEKIKELS